MESTNLNEEEYNEHQLETHRHAWRPPTFLLNNNNIHASCEEETSANSMIQNMGNFAWASPNLIDDQQTLISNNKMSIKQESSSISSFHPRNSSPSTFPTEILNPTPTELLLLNTLSPNYKHPAILANRELQHQGVTTNFSQIFPTVNISNFGTNNNNRNHDNNSNNESGNISELMSSHELDGFATERLINEGNLIAPSNSHMLELFKLEKHHHQQSSDVNLWNKANNPSSFDNNGVVESNRTGCIEEPILTQDRQMVSKKSRFESRSSGPPFKVRKEKLGDRIAALQQLVAPFGKTDTASVLMEAIGYIKFLQDQVETLSVPYMKLSASRNKFRTKISDSQDGEINVDEEKEELRSRGLCLVPASCMTYIAGDASCNGALWPPPNFHPGF